MKTGFNRAASPRDGILSKDRKGGREKKPAKAPRIAGEQSRAVADAGAGNSAVRGKQAARTSKLTLVLPLPPKEYSANESSGRSWHAQRGKRGARESAYAAVLEAVGRTDWMPGQQFRHPKTSVTFCLPNHIRRDHGGLVERMKPYWDSLTEPLGQKAYGLGIYKDDNLEDLGWPAYRHRYEKPGCVIIEIEEDTHA